MNDHHRDKIITYMYNTCRYRLSRQGPDENMTPLAGMFDYDADCIAVIPLPWHNNIMKHHLVRAFGDFMREQAGLKTGRTPVYYAIASEAFAAPAPADYKGESEVPTELMPRNHPERQEVLSVYIENKDGEVDGAMWTLTRNKRGQYTGFARQPRDPDEKVESPTGLFTGLLVQRGRMN